MTPNRVLNPAATARLGLQNRVLRRLREQGVQVIAVDSDPDLTLLVDASAGPLLRRQASCITTRRSAVGTWVSVHVDECRVVWNEVHNVSPSTMSHRSKS